MIRRKRALAGLVAESLEARHLLTQLIDIDADGDLDAVGSNAWFENIDGRGNLGKHPFADTTSSAFRVGDLDGDRDLDILTSRGAWYENRDGQGDFSAQHSWGEGLLYIGQLRLSDSDQDGDLDIVVTGYDSRAELYLNDGSGGFRLRSTSTGSSFVWYAAGDVDGDGDLDTFTVERQSDGEECHATCDVVLLNRQQGKDVETEQLMALTDGEVIRGIRLADIDGDELEDLVVEREFSWQWFPNERGRFHDPQPGSASGDGLRFFTDIDDDGNVDAVFHDLEVELGWSLGPEDAGPFGPASFHAVDLPTTETSPYIDAIDVTDLGDINRDGIVDFLTAKSLDDGPVWIDGSTAQIHPQTKVRTVGDSNGDGIFDSTDLVVVYQAGEYEDGIEYNSTFEEGDWNSDGDFGLSDLVHVFQVGDYLSTAHPRLLFSQQDVPRIRDAVVSGRYSNRFETDKRFALSLLEKDYSDPALFEQQKSLDAVRIAFVVLMLEPGDADRSRLADKAREALLHINDGLWSATITQPDHHATWEINELHPWYSGSSLMEYSLAYDWLVGAGELAGVDRTDVRFRILRLAQIEHSIHSTPMDEFDRSNYQVRNANMRFRSLAGVGIAALTFPEQAGLIDDLYHRLPDNALPFDSTQVLKYVIGELFEQITIASSGNPTTQSMIEHYVSPDGVYLEGLTYQKNAFGVLTPFLVSYHKNTGIDYISGNGPADGRIAEMYTNNVRFMMPDRGRPTIGDSWTGKWYPYHELIASYTTEPDLHRWYFEEVLGSWTKYLGVSASALMAESGPVTTPEFRTEFFPDAGLAVFRDEWGPDATYMMLVAQGRPVRGHRQADQGSILMYANGAHLVLDPGYGAAYHAEEDGWVEGGKANWIKSSLAHSGITVDSVYGVAETPNEELRKEIHPRAATVHSYSTVLDPTELRNTFASPDIDYAEAHVEFDVKNAEWTRAIAFPRHKYFVVEDSLTAEAAHEYGWQLHFGDTSTGKLIGSDQEYVWVTPNKHGESVALGISMLDSRRQVRSFTDGPTNRQGFTYPDHVFDHTYIIAEESAQDTHYVTLLEPHKTTDVRLDIETLVDEHAWRITHSATAYDLILSRPNAGRITIGEIETDATFLVASIDLVEGKEVLRSVFAKGSTSIAVGYDHDQVFETAADELFHYESPLFN